jgi:branched-chain amino acid transport system ATP-binding protein
LRTTYDGEILLDGSPVDRLPAYERPQRGLVLVPERRRLFPFMTVLENLEIGAYSASARQRAKQTIEEVYELLPVLAERRKQVARLMSGGEQQMLAIGRALMARPRVLLLDEPTEGLAPIYVKLLFDLIVNLRDHGMTVMIVEQNVHHVLRTADRAYVIENGRIVMEGEGAALLKDERLKVAYLGL